MAWIKGCSLDMYEYDVSVLGRKQHTFLKRDRTLYVQRMTHLWKIPQHFSCDSYAAFETTATIQLEVYLSAAR